MISYAALRVAVPCYAAIWGSGYLVYLTSPILVGAMVDGLGLDERQAGLIVTVELLVLAGTTLGLAPLMARLSPRRCLAILGPKLPIPPDLRLHPSHRGDRLAAQGSGPPSRRDCA